MKLATVRHEGVQRVGRVDKAERMLALFGPDITDARDLIGQDLDQPLSDEQVALSDVTLLAPIPRPGRNIMCVGKNYREHAREFARSGFEAGAVAGKDLDTFPALFSKLPSTVIGPGAAIELHPSVTQKVDYEAELAVVIGTGGRNIPASRAYDHVWAYTILNDVTARDLQRDHKQWFHGKSLDTFAPMGPWLVTAGDIEPTDLRVTCHVNGVLRQDANTRDLIFDIPTLIAALSAGTTLEPGDIIATGTPAGVGIGMDPPTFLKAGDEVSIAISGIGTLSNTCIAG